MSEHRKQLDTGMLDAPQAVQQLQHLKEAGVQLAASSLQLLSLDDTSACAQFAKDSAGHFSSSSAPYVTCMDVIRKAKDEVSTAQRFCRTSMIMLWQNYTLLWALNHSAGALFALEILLESSFVDQVSFAAAVLASVHVATQPSAAAHVLQTNFLNAGHLVVHVACGGAGALAEGCVCNTCLGPTA